MLKDVKAAIFDMDGTLIDSMWVWGKIDEDYLLKRGLNMPDTLRDHIEHLSIYDTAIYFKEKFNLEDSLDEILKEWHDMAMAEYRDNVFLKPGADDFIKSLKDRGIKIALATSNSVPLLEMILKKYNIYNYFDVITTTDEVERNKSFPDVYLLTAERLKVSPEECVVFEDILPAIKGAKSAGMKVVAVYDSFSHHNMDAIILESDKFIKDYSNLK